MKKMTLLAAMFLTLISFGFGQEMFVNGDLEAWDDASTPTSWDLADACAQESTIIHGGSFSARITGPTTGGNILKQVIVGIVGGHEYDLSFWFLDNDNKAKVKLASVWIRADGSTAGDWKWPSPSTDDANWINFTDTQTAPADAVKLRFVLRVMKQGSGGGYIYFDDFSLVDNAPPTVVEAPTFTPPAGNYTGTQNVTITSATSGATIYYTTDGSEPDDSSTEYTTPVTIATTTTLKAIAYKTGMTESDITTGVYTITAPATVEAPTFTPPAGNYTGTQNVTIASATSGATIYYTTDGSEPDDSSTEYTTPVSIASTTTLKAIAYKVDMTESDVTTGLYTITLPPAVVEAPVFTPPAGYYPTDQYITITSATPGASIYYTLDDSTPDENSTPYTTPVHISSTIAIRAIAMKTGMTDSDVTIGVYTISPTPPAVPIGSAGILIAGLLIGGAIVIRRGKLF